MAGFVDGIRIWLGGGPAGQPATAGAHLARARQIHARRAVVGILAFFLLLAAAAWWPRTTTTVTVQCPASTPPAVVTCAPGTMTTTTRAPLGTSGVAALISAAGVIIVWLLGDAVAERQHIQQAGGH